MIGGISHISYTYPAAGVGSIGSPVTAAARVSALRPLGEKSTIRAEKTTPSECQTCKERKYVDGSNEANVSFKTPGHVSPQSSYAAVAAHEQQHVSNAVAEGSQPGSELVSASVSYKMAVCPECGTPYMSGGSTRTVMKYNESNPYESSRKSLEGSLLRGMNFDAVA